jgi:hypothetical protein
MTVALGALGVMEYFRKRNSRIVYRTITLGPSRVNITVGTRWVLNMKTLKAEWMWCKEKVKRVSREN